LEHFKRNAAACGLKRWRASGAGEMVCLAIPRELEVVDGMPDGAKIPELEGTPSAFAPDYAPEEMFEIATKLYKKSR
jgi:Mn-containing catalase